jgi:hypothetical protein
MTLLSNRVRTSGSAAPPYRSNAPDDTRFRNDFVSVQSIATSHGQNDAGLFELNLRDERFLPFEGRERSPAGASTCRRRTTPGT